MGRTDMDFTYTAMRWIIGFAIADGIIMLYLIGHLVYKALNDDFNLDKKNKKGKFK